MKVQRRSLFSFSCISEAREPARGGGWGIQPAGLVSSNSKGEKSPDVVVVAAAAAAAVVKKKK